MTVSLLATLGAHSSFWSGLTKALDASYVTRNYRVILTKYAFTYHW